MLRSGELLPEYEASQFVPQSLYLVRVFRRSKAVRELKKRLLFLLAGFNSQLDEFDQNAVVAQPPAIRNPFNLFSHRRGKGHAAPDLSCGCHATSIHHCGAHSDSAVWEAPNASGNRGEIDQLAALYNVLFSLYD